MDKDIKHIDLIEKYLDEKISPEELKEFEVRMKDSKSFRELYRGMEYLIPGIRYSARNSMMDDLKKVDKSLPKFKVKGKTKIIDFKNKLIWIAAASIILAISIIAVLNMNNNSYNHIFADNYKPYPNVINATTRTAEEVVLNPKEMAYSAYDNQDYIKAIELFESLDAQNFDTGALFYLGNSYMAKGNTKTAEEKFEQLLVNKGKFQIQAKWYLALCYLKDKEIEHAEIIFKEIVLDNSSYSKKAFNILNQLK